MNVPTYFSLNGAAANSGAARRSAAFTVADDLSSLTPDFVTAVLRRAGRINWATVRGIEHEPLGREPRRAGTILKLHLDYDTAEPGAPASLIAKLPAASKNKRAACENETMLRAVREVQFYRQLAATGNVPAPGLLYGATAIERSSALLVLDDAAESKLGEVGRGCSADDAALVVEAMARLHAAWWRSQPATNYPWLPSWGADAAAQGKRLDAQVPVFLLKFGHRLPRRIKVLVEALGNGYGALLGTMERAPQTLINGDLQLDAVLFHKERGRAAASIVDWPSAMQGPGVADFALFLSGALEARVRREVERELLALYYARLLEAGIRGYRFADLLQGYRLGLLWALARTVERLATTDTERLVGRERTLVDGIFEKGRLFAALLDHNSAEMIAA